MPTFESSYRISNVGFSGRIPFTAINVGYFFPLLDNATITVSNAVTGDNTNYNAPASPNFPVLYMLASTVDCRIRQRVIHPSVQSPGDTAGLFSRAVASCGYTNVPAATDQIRSLTLPTANISDGTTSLATRMFNEINGGSYGTWLPARTVLPLIISGWRDCWIQVIARDGSGSATSGEILFACVSDLNIVGY